MARIKSTGFWVCSFLLIGALGCEGGGDKKCPGGICDVPTIDYGALTPRMTQAPRTHLLTLEVTWKL